ncbi:hypothetical protein IP88_13885 [alpha proteobacterium AAP81b]|nr:hypothetical protein IP88_13885 [alpha proteobacterium AAP81b]
MAFNICMVRIAGYPHTAAFDDLGTLLAAGLADLGHPVRLAANQIADNARNIVIGAHLLDVDPAAAALPAGTIIVNTEPLRDDGALPHDGRIWAERVLRWARHCAIWDYSEASTALLRARSGGDVRYLRLGWHPSLHRVAAAAEQDIDVLFYGAIDERRAAILRALDDQVRVTAVFGVYGAPRDALITRAKVVLNLHRDENALFEAVRVAFLMNNAKAVVAEVGPRTVVDPAYLPGFAGAAYDALVPTTLALVADGGARAALEARALATLQAMPQAAILANLLAG